MRTFPLALLLAGCVGRYDSVDEACDDAPLGGAEALGDVAPGFLERVNCYRRYLGLRSLRVADRAQQSAEAHLAYLAEVDALNPESVHYSPSRVQILGEDETVESATGASPFERAVASGAKSQKGDLDRGSVYAWFLYDAGLSADVVLQHPFAREVFLQPLVIGVGHAEGTVSGVKRGYLDLVTDFPSGRRVGRPIVFPRDGQEGVPPSWVDAEIGDARLVANVDGPIGFPITVTVSDDDATPRWYDPYGLVVVSATLTVEGDATPLDLAQVVPRIGQAMPLRTTAVFAARRPLAEDTAYVFEAELKVNGATTVVRTAFTTGGAGAPVETDTDTDM